MTWSFPIDEEGGFVVIDKPKGPTSHQIDYWVRELTGIARVGHVGTLDPQATGVLVMALGKSTRLIDIAHEQSKEYVGIMKLHSNCDKERIDEVFKEFTGEIYQLPPMRSAVARRIRSRKVFELELIEMKERNVLFRVKCESGTYIRTLCVDIGYVLGCGANMTDLRRTKSGIFTELQAVSMQAFSDSVELSKAGKGDSLRSMFHDSTYIFRDNAKIVVKESAVANISRGSDLYPGGIRRIIGEPLKNDRVMVSSESGRFLGTGIMLSNFTDISELKIVDFDRIMVDPKQSQKNPDAEIKEELSTTKVIKRDEKFMAEKKPSWDNKTERRPYERKPSYGKEGYNRDRKPERPQSNYNRDSKPDLKYPSEEYPRKKQEESESGSFRERKPFVRNDRPSGDRQGERRPYERKPSYGKEGYNRDRKPERPQSNYNRDSKDLK
ncbi:MAG: RNA-guided pseudouridylation complex pseudouridine synthase subunit Cbf5, partial [Thermoplasmataceae archaeon]